MFYIGARKNPRTAMIAMSGPYASKTDADKDMVIARRIVDLLCPQFLNVKWYIIEAEAEMETSLQSRGYGLPLTRRDADKARRLTLLYSQSRQNNSCYLA